MQTVIRCVRVIFVFLFVRPLGYLCFKKKYLTGKYFSHLYSRGWLWVLRGIFYQKILGFNREIPWPVSCRMNVGIPEHIHFHPDDLNNFQSFGSYFQGLGNITIGYGSYIAPNVGLITSNHNILNPDDHDTPEDILIGKQCWIGMNSVILPGVCLGDHTVVGAGSIVTKSFSEGYCVIAGNPAKLIKNLK